MSILSASLSKSAPTQDETDEATAGVPEGSGGLARKSGGPKLRQELPLHPAQRREWHHAANGIDIYTYIYIRIYTATPDHILK